MGVEGACAAVANINIGVSGVLVVSLGTGVLAGGGRNSVGLIDSKDLYSKRQGTTVH